MQISYLLMSKNTIHDFKAKKRKLSYKANVIINDQPINQVNYTKFLGLYIDKELTWKYHINHVTVKAAKMTGIMAKARHFLPLKRLITLYNTMIYPLYIDKELTWKYHINHVTVKAATMTGIMAKARHFLPLKNTTHIM